MRILSLDTSFSFINFSVIEEGKIKFLWYSDSKRKTLEQLPFIFERESIDISSFSAFAVSKGVGYLTSLRIGITFMKTWSYLYKKPIIAFENLKLLAYFAGEGFPKIPYLKVSSYIFYQIFYKNGSTCIKTFNGEKLDGVGITLSLWEERICKKNKVFEFFPFSAYGGIYAYKLLEKGEIGDDPFSVEPIYIR